MTPKLAVIAAALIGAAAGGAALSAQRPIEIADVFRTESIQRYYGGPLAVAPDGERMAFARTRPKSSSANFKNDFLWDMDNADVWVRPRADADPVNITNGATDGSGWWAPSWSADGRYLTMLSTRGEPVADNVWLWVWDSRTNALRKLTSRGIDLNTLPYNSPCLWTDGTHVMCPLLEQGARPLTLMIERQVAMVAMDAWPKAMRGKEVTASVLESGKPSADAQRQHGDFARIDVTNGETTIVSRDSATGLQLSPDGKHVAYALQVGLYTPASAEVLRQSASAAYALAIATSDGKEVMTSQHVAKDVIPASIRWSPDGKSVAVVAYTGARDGDQRLHIVSVDNKHIDSIDLRKLDLISDGNWWTPTQIDWASGQRLLLRAAQRTSDAKANADARRDWWLVSRDGTRRNVTRNMKDVPEVLWPEPSRESFVGVAGGKLWRVSIQGTGGVAMGGDFKGAVTAFAWPVHTNSGQEEYPLLGRTYGEVVVSVRDEHAMTTPWHVDLTSGAAKPVQHWSADSKVVRYLPKSRTYVVSETSSKGQRLSLESERGSTTLASINQFLGDLQEAPFRQIEYVSLNGEKLKGWLILPIGYESGKRYPLLTWVYAGSVYKDTPPTSDRIGGFLSPYSMQIPAAKGYAVLLPSMPLNTMGEPDDPMLRLTNGVLPAVDEAVRLGIADPQKLFLMGHSFGGFSTYGLVTQTNRFKRAVACAGLSDLISLYSQFDARQRYEPRLTDGMEGMFESGQVAMGAPPWQDLNRYLRNSPIFSVDRVSTPLMIIQGDMDYVAIQQGEEFFASLHRLGKRASFVRYWGEGHVLRSPANAQDMWKRIFAWFEEEGS